MGNDPALLQEVETLIDDIQAIRQILKHATDADIVRSGLTGPQISVLKALTAHNGLSLKELSQRVRLAHSTVSGIVDRLERQGLVQRIPDEHDRRFSRIFAVDRVMAYVERGEALHRPAVLVNALASLSPGERASMLDGIAALRRLLETSQHAEP